MCYFDGKLQKSKTQFTDIAENLIHKIKILRIFYHLARNFAHSAHKKQSPTACRCDAQWGRGGIGTHIEILPAPHYF